MHELTKMSSDWVLSQAAQHREQSWPQFEADLQARSEIPPAPSGPVADYLDRVEQQVAQDVKREAKIDKRLQAPPFGDLIRRGIEKCIAFGVPKEWVPAFGIDETIFKKATDAACYSHSQRKVFINMACPFWKGMRSAPVDNWNSTIADTGDVVHEICHSVRHAHLGAGDQRPFQVDAAFEKTAGQVSEYAKRSASEFCAETLTGLIHGRTYPADVMALYQRLGGWLPRGYHVVAKAADPQPVHVDVHVPAPVVTVNVPPQAPPQVTVHPEIKMPSTTTSVKVIRDRNSGRMIGAESETNPKE